MATVDELRVKVDADVSKLLSAAAAGELSMKKLERVVSKVRVKQNALKSFDRLKSQVDRTSQSITRMGKAAQVMSSITKRGRVMEDAFRSIGNNAFVVTAAMGGFAAIAIKSAADLERGITRAALIAENGRSIWTSSFAKMEESVLGLASKTEFTTSQLSGALQFLTQAGQNTSTSLATLPKVAQLASAAQIDLAKAADITTNVMAGYGLKVEDLAKVNNTLLATSLNANTSVLQLGAAFETVGPIASALGLELKETAALAGVLSNAGVRGEEAGTGLKRAFTAIINASPKAQKALDRLGIKVGDLTNPKRGFKAVVKDLARLKTELGDDPNLKKNFVADIFQALQQRAGTKVLPLINQVKTALESGKPGPIDALIEKIDKANADNLAESIEQVQLKTLTGQFNILRSALDGFLITVGKELVPVIRDFVLGLTDLFNSLKNLDGGVRTFLVGIGKVVFIGSAATFVFAKIASAVGSFLSVLGIGAFLMKDFGISLAMVGKALKTGLIAGLKLAGAALAGFAAGWFLVNDEQDRAITKFLDWSAILDDSIGDAGSFKLAFLQAFGAVATAIANLTDLAITLASKILDFIPILGNLKKVAEFLADKLEIDLQVNLEARVKSFFDEAIDREKGSLLSAKNAGSSDASVKAIQKVVDLQEDIKKSNSKIAELTGKTPEAVAKLTSKAIETAGPALLPGIPSGKAGQELSKLVQQRNAQVDSLDQARLSLARLRKASEEAAKVVSKTPEQVRQEAAARAEAERKTAAAAHKLTAALDKLREGARKSTILGKKLKEPKMSGFFDALESFAERGKKIAALAKEAGKPGKAMLGANIAASRKQLILDSRSFLKSLDTSSDDYTSTFKRVVSKIARVTRKSTTEIESLFASGGVFAQAFTFDNKDFARQTSADFPILAGMGFEKSGVESAALDDGVAALAAVGMNGQTLAEAIRNSTEALWQEEQARKDLLKDLKAEQFEDLSSAIISLAQGELTAGLGGVGEVIGDQFRDPEFTKGAIKGFQSLFGDVGKKVADAASKLASAFFDGTGVAGGALGAAIGSIAPGLGTAVGAGIGNMLSEVGPAVLGAVRSVVDALREGATFLVQTIPNMLSEAGGKLADIVPDNRFKEIFQAISNPALGSAAALSVLAAAATPLVVALGALLAPAVSAVAGLVLFLGTLVAVATIIPNLIIASFLLAATGIAALVISMVAVALAPLAPIVGLVTASFLGLLGNVALFSGFLAAFSQSEGFDKLKSGFAAVIDKLVIATEPFVNKLMAFVGLFDAFISVFIPIFEAMSNLNLVVRVAFEALKTLAVAISVVVFSFAAMQSVLLAFVTFLATTGAQLAAFFEFLEDGFITVLASIVSMISELFKSVGLDDMGLGQAAIDLKKAAEATGPHGAAAAALEAVAAEATAAQPDLNEMALRIRDLTKLSYDEAIARGEGLSKMKELNEELTNIPEGFKVARARFEAIDPSAGVLPPGASPQDGGDLGTTNIFSDAVFNIIAEDAQGFFDEIQRQISDSNNNQTGNPNSNQQTRNR